MVKFTLEDQNVIINSYRVKTFTELAEQFQCSASDIRRVLMDNNITRKRFVYCNASEAWELDVCEHFKTHSVPMTAEYFLVTTYTVMNVLKKHCVQLRTRSEELILTRIQHYGSLDAAKNAATDTCKKTSLERYGVDNFAKSDQFLDKMQKTCQQRYGVDNPMQSDKVKLAFNASCQTSLGVDWPTQNHDVLQKRTDNNSTQYGGNGWASPSIMLKYRDTMLERYGIDNPMRSDSIKQTLSATVQERYGVPWHCMAKECRKYSTNNSAPNKNFSQLLTNNSIEHITEFHLNRYSYDFKVDSNLIEINPTPTHNINWSPFSDTGLSPDYHKSKTDTAEQAGYRCIHVWDWDDVDKVVQLLKPRKRIYGRQCTVRTLSSKEATQFTNLYHMQGSVKSDYCLGLIYNGDIVSVMTFGKPRYNKKYDYELLRYCSNHQVIGGSEKLFSYFLTEKSPTSVISYCDCSKFTGATYQKLGFQEVSCSLSKHWYNMSLHKHITDNLLRQRGFDQLLGAQFGTFGKGTSNEDLMRQFRFDEIVDAGQKTYSWFS